MTQLQTIPGIGPRCEEALQELGYDDVESLAHQDPTDMYARMCDASAEPVDRCVLYVFRCAVYYASNASHDPELLKWWNWKNREF